MVLGALGVVGVVGVGDNWCVLAVFEAHDGLDFVFIFQNV